LKIIVPSASQHIGASWRFATGCPVRFINRAHACVRHSRHKDLTGSFVTLVTFFTPSLFYCVCLCMCVRAFECVCK